MSYFFSFEHILLQLNYPFDHTKSLVSLFVINLGLNIVLINLYDLNGAAVATGVRWVGGNPPPSTSNEDILTFSIIRDGTGVTRVYCSSSINIS